MCDAVSERRRCDWTCHAHGFNGAGPPSLKEKKKTFASLHLHCCLSSFLLIFLGERMGGKMGGGRCSRSSRNRKRIWWVATFFIFVFFWFPSLVSPFLLSHLLSRQPHAHNHLTNRNEAASRPSNSQAAGQIPTLNTGFYVCTPITCCFFSTTEKNERDFQRGDKINETISSIFK